MDIWNLETAPKAIQNCPQENKESPTVQPEASLSLDIWNLEAALKMNQNSSQEKKEVPVVQPEALMPYIKNRSELIIPSNCPEKYKWWKDGQSIFETLLELDAPDTLVEKHITKGCPRSWKRWQEILEERTGNKS